MPILLVNDTDGSDVTWNISGVNSDGSTKMIVSGMLGKSGSQTAEVSGYVSYDVTFEPIGTIDPGGTVNATKRVTDHTTCILGITVFAGVNEPKK